MLEYKNAQNASSLTPPKCNDCTYSLQQVINTHKGLRIEQDDIRYVCADLSRIYWPLWSEYGSFLEISVSGTKCRWPNRHRSSRYFLRQ